MKPLIPLEFKHRLKQEALRLGFADCRVTHADDIAPEEQARLLDWLARGHHDRMAYMAREPLKRTKPRELLADAQSVVCLSARYAASQHESSAPAGFGRVARYARGADYHRVLGVPLKALESWLVEQGGPQTMTRRFCDAGPLLERAFAARAGLGFVGKNTMLINPAEGSWMFLAAIVTNIEMEPDLPISGTCGRCTRCLDACPTQALREPYVLDSRRCVSNLTIERRGEFSEEESRWLGDWVFGCDICQEVCPYNKKPSTASFDGLGAENFADGTLRLSDLAELQSNSAFERRFGHSPLLRARLKGLRRNADSVLNNQFEDSSDNERA